MVTTPTSGLTPFVVRWGHVPLLLCTTLVRSPHLQHRALPAKLKAERREWVQLVLHLKAQSLLPRDVPGLLCRFILPNGFF